MLLIVLLLLFTVVMGIWAFLIHDQQPGGSTSGSWLAFAACLILGIVVFLVGTGTLSLPRGP